MLHLEWQLLQYRGHHAQVYNCTMNWATSLPPYMQKRSARCDEKPILHLFIEMRIAAGVSLLQKRQALEASVRDAGFQDVPELPAIVSHMACRC